MQKCFAAHIIFEKCATEFAFLSLFLSGVRMESESGEKKSRAFKRSFKEGDAKMVEKLRQLKKKSQMTNQQIAEKSNIPESTVARIFSGKTPNPTIATVIAMARAMGGSAADLLGDEDKIDERTPPANADASAAEPSKNVCIDDDGPHLSVDGAVHKKIYEDMLKLYKEELRKKDVWIARLFWCLAGVTAFILIVLLFDILNPSFGFVKY